MARTLQAAALPRIETRQLPAAAALAALGIVYGDIGTSPLYAFKQAADAGGTLSHETIMGVASADAIDYLCRDKRCHTNRILAWPEVGREGSNGDRRPCGGILGQGGGAA
jgi:hypothetical protein